jgi:hypothetical protein
MVLLLKVLVVVLLCCNGGGCGEQGGLHQKMSFVKVVGLSEKKRYDHLLIYSFGDFDSWAFFPFAIHTTSFGVHVNLLP